MQTHTNRASITNISVFGFFSSLKNVNAAIAVGIIGLHFKDAKTLLQDLSLMGVQISTDEINLLEDQLS